MRQRCRIVYVVASLVCASPAWPAERGRSVAQWITVCPGCPANPFGITDNGVISGNVSTAQGERGFLMKNGEPATYVDAPVDAQAGQLIELLRGNNRGQFIGVYLLFADFSVRGFVREPDGTTRDVVYPNAPITVVGDISGNGDIVGSYTSDISTATGWTSFIYSRGTFAETFTYPDPRANGTIALGFNARQEIVGVFTLEGSPTLHGFQRRHDGTYVEIAFSAASEVYLTEINNAGTAVGNWRDLSGAYHGLVYRDGLCYTLDPGRSPAGYTNATLTGINNQGDVVGVAFLQSPGDGDGFLISGGATAAIHTRAGVACVP
jgi:hypothetical protein